MKFLVKVGKLSPFILAIVFPLFIILLVLHYLFFTSPAISSEDSTFVIIPENSTPEQIGAILTENNLVRNSFVAEILIEKQLKKLDEPPKIAGGEYKIEPKSLPSEIIHSILNGKPVLRTFNVEAGMTITDVCNAVAKSGLFSKEEIEQAFSNSQLLIRRNIPASTPEGFIVPTERTFTKPITPEVVAESILKAGEIRRKDIIPDLLEKAYSLGLDEFKALTLASLIEKSGAAKEEDKKRISSIIINRLTIGMPVEDEMSLKYQSNDFDRVLTDQDLKKPSPYNTFLKEGLPPTPICNPSLDSIKAAINPSDTDFLYYFKDKRGVFQYSPTLEAHQKLKDQLTK
jgi:UPF0755 protein